jgi:hypothetical protein
MCSSPLPMPGGGGFSSKIEGEPRHASPRRPRQSIWRSSTDVNEASSSRRGGALPRLTSSQNSTRLLVCGKASEGTGVPTRVAASNTADTSVKAPGTGSIPLDPATAVGTSAKKCAESKEPPGRSPSRSSSAASSAPATMSRAGPRQTAGQHGRIVSRQRATRSDMTATWPSHA